MKNNEIQIFALAAHGLGLSGSDRIFIEFARRWGKHSKVHIWVWQEGYGLCKRQNLGEQLVNFHVLSMKPWNSFGFLVNYIARIFAGIKIGMTLNLGKENSIMIYSASEFWMDLIPAWILKLRFPKNKWAAAWYQTAPKPWKGFSENGKDRRYSIRAIPYWMIQLLVRPIVNNFADYVLVNNSAERMQFNNLEKKHKTIEVPGAIDLQAVESYKRNHKDMVKKHEGIFQGRFHPQKGVLELVDIWKLVVDKKRDAKLVMIGDGPLMKDIQTKIKSLGLGENIILTGYLFDGVEKYGIFAQSKMVLHPSFYDSGGMAAAEAMAFGLPCIGFDLDSYKSYYPKGMIKVEIGNLKEFADVVISLLNDPVRRDKVGSEGYEMIKNNWSWDKRANEIFHEINK